MNLRVIRTGSARPRELLEFQPKADIVHEGTVEVTLDFLKWENQLSDSASRMEVSELRIFELPPKSKGPIAHLAF